MNEKISFAEKVRSMTAKEIIMAMVEGLKNPAVKVDMSSFGGADSHGVCFGCAATNTVCRILGETYTKGDIRSLWLRSKFTNTPMDILAEFELAIDSLRKGDLFTYNERSKTAGIRPISNFNNLTLPCLTNNYTSEQLDVYVQLADSQL